MRHVFKISFIILFVSSLAGCFPDIWGRYEVKPITNNVRLVEWFDAMGIAPRKDQYQVRIEGNWYEALSKPNILPSQKYTSEAFELTPRSKGFWKISVMVTLVVTQAGELSVSIHTKLNSKGSQLIVHPYLSCSLFKVSRMAHSRGFEPLTSTRRALYQLSYECKRFSSDLQRSLWNGYYNYWPICPCLLAWL